MPLILLTARADEATKLKALETGTNDFLSKPFSLAELHVQVKNLHASHQLEKALSRQNKRLEVTIDQLKEAELQLVQAEKMASLGRMSAGIIHEINNPLNFTLTALSLLARQGGHLPAEVRGDYQETLDDIEEGLRRVAKIIADLREFTHPQGGRLEAVDVDHAVDTALRFLTAEWKDRVRIEREIPEDFCVPAAGSKLMQVLVNLLQNSLDALRSKPPGADATPTIRIVARTVPGGRALVVWDNGSGIPQHHLSRVFDPFFTTKEVGQGTGLGLSICYRLLQEVGASITVRSQEGVFCEFTLTFPDGKPEPSLEPCQQPAFVS